MGSWNLAVTLALTVLYPPWSLLPFITLKTGKRKEIPKAMLFPGYNCHPSLPTEKM
jgi:hypothetical protein